MPACRLASVAVVFCLCVSCVWAQQLVELRNFDEPFEEYGSMAFDDEWKTLYSSGTGTSIKVSNVETGKVLSFFDKPTLCFTSVMALSGDGKVLAAGGSDRKITLFQTSDGKVIRQLHMGGWVRSLAFLDDNKTLLSSSDKNKAVLWDTATGEESAAWNIDDDYFVRLSPDQKTLASMGDTRVITLWDMATKQPIARLPGNAREVYDVAFRADGKLLVSGDRWHPYHVRVWDLTTNQPVTQFEGKDDGVSAVAFHPAGKLAASAKLNGTIELWDVGTSKLVDSTGSGVSNPGGLQFSPDGKLLAQVYGVTEGASGVRIWKLETGSQDSEMPLPEP